MCSNIKINQLKFVIDMKTMKLWRIAFMMLTAFSIASCGSDEPRYADPENRCQFVTLIFLSPWNCFYLH